MDCPCNVSVAKLEPEFFPEWEEIRKRMLIMTIPLLQMVPEEEKLFIVDNIILKDFSAGQFIVREGEIGTEFYIVREGSAIVVKEIGVPAPVHIVTLKEGG